MKKRFKPEINGRGLWLAKAMLNGPGQKKRNFPYTSVSGDQRKLNLGPLSKPGLSEKVKNEEKTD